MISSLELARLCDVSQGTVDRALHDRPGIGRTTKARVLAAAREHGYLPHPAARELLTGDRKQIGAVIPAVNSVFFMDLMNAIQEELAPRAFRFFMTPVQDREGFLDAVRDFSARRSRAVLLLPPEDDLQVQDEIVGKDTSLMALINPCRGSNIRFVAPNEERTGRDATAYLLGKGHTRTLHLTYPRASYAMQARAKGYTDVVREFGFRPITLVSPDERKLIEAVKKHKSTALFCHNDWLALSAMRMLQTNGLRVPDDISVLGVDHSPTFTALCPDITSMAYPYRGIAQAVRERLEGVAEPAAVPACRAVEGKTVREV